MAAALGLSRDDLDALLHSVESEPTADPVTGTLGFGEWEEIDEVLRRRFLAASAASAVAPSFVPDAASELLRPGRPGGQVGAGDVAAVRRMTTVLGDAGSEFGGGHLLVPTLRYVLDDVQRFLDGDAGRHRRDLDAAASEITQLAAWMAQDAGRDDLAADLYWKANSLGNDACDPELAATALRGLASMAGEKREFAEAVRLAEQAVDTAGSLDHPKARAYYACSLATAASLDGDKPLALASLASSQTHIERAVAAPGSSWASHYSPGRWAHEAGLILSRVGELDAAADHMHLSLDIHGLDRKRTRAMVLADLGVVRLKQGDVDTAMTTWAEFLECSAAVCSTRITSALKDMAARLARVGGTDATALRTRALEKIATIDSGSAAV